MNAPISTGRSSLFALFITLALPLVAFAEGGPDTSKVPDPEAVAKIKAIQGEILALPAGPVRAALERRLVETLGITAYDDPTMGGYLAGAAVGAAGYGAIGLVGGGLVGWMAHSWAPLKYGLAGGAIIGAGLGALGYKWDKADEKKEATDDVNAKIDRFNRLLTVAKEHPYADISRDSAGLVAHPGFSRHESAETGGTVGWLASEDSGFFEGLLGLWAGDKVGKLGSAEGDEKNLAAAIKALENADTLDPANAAVRAKALAKRYETAGDVPSLPGYLGTGATVGFIGAAAAMGVRQIATVGGKGAFLKGAGMLLSGGTPVTQAFRLGGLAVGLGAAWLLHNRAMKKHNNALDLDDVKAAAPDSSAIEAHVNDIQGAEAGTVVDETPADAQATTGSGFAEDEMSDLINTSEPIEPDGQ